MSVLSRRKKQTPSSEGPLFSSTWRLGFKKLAILRLVGKRWNHFSDVRARSVVFLEVALLALVPTLLDLFLRYVRPAYSLKTAHAAYWLWGFAAINALMMLAAINTWSFASARAEQVDDLLVSSHDKKQVADYLHATYTPWRQLALPIAGAVAACVYLYLFRATVEAKLELNIASYVSVAWSAFLGSCLIYWLFAAPAVVTTIARSQELCLHWLNPAATPGVRALSHVLELSMATVLVGGVSISVVGFVVPNTAQIWPLRAVLIGFFFVLCLAALSLYLPVYELHKAIATCKNRSLERLAKQVSSLDTLSNSSESVAMAQIYQSIAQSPDWPMPTAALAQYGAAMASTLIAFILSQRV